MNTLIILGRVWLDHKPNQVPRNDGQNAKTYDGASMAPSGVAPVNSTPTPGGTPTARK